MQRPISKPRQWVNCKAERNQISNDEEGDRYLTRDRQRAISMAMDEYKREVNINNSQGVHRRLYEIYKRREPFKVSAILCDITTTQTKGQKNRRSKIRKRKKIQLSNSGIYY